MLNNNDLVHIIPEPIGRLALQSKSNTNREDAAIKEFNNLKNAMEKLETNPNYTVIGFNEKLLSPKFALPEQYSEMAALADYLQSNSYR